MMSPRWMGAIRQDFFVPSARPSKMNLFTKQVIADQQRRFHGLGGNFERLNDESGAEESEQNGDAEEIRRDSATQIFRRSRSGVRGQCATDPSARLRVGNTYRGCGAVVSDCHEFPSGFGVARSRISRAARAASCSASFLLRPADAESLSPSARPPLQKFSDVPGRTRCEHGIRRVFARVAGAIPAAPICDRRSRVLRRVCEGRIEQGAPQKRCCRWSPHQDRSRRGSPRRRRRAAFSYRARRFFLRPARAADSAQAPVSCAAA